ncbi:MAG: arginase family protein [Candidatus Aenigmatarchaeota archaeon]
MHFSLLGVPWDKSQTYRKGAAKAPDVIRKVLPHLETWHAGVDLADSAFMKDLGNVKAKDFNTVINDVFAALHAMDVPVNSVPVILGGEHTVSLAAVRALKPRRVVILDAHPDAEDTFGHTGVVRRIAEQVGPANISLYGVRTLSKEEHAWLASNRIHIASLKDLWKIREPVYLSVDFDVLDPHVLPAVGNPEPAGLSFVDVLNAVHALAPRIAAMDFVEFTPFPCAHANEVHALTAGKLIYAAMAEVVRAQAGQRRIDSTFAKA